MTAANSFELPPPRPIKRVLVLAYSQTGQLTEIAARILAPLYADPHITIHVEHLRPVTPYPFPWPFFRFLDAFPESAHLIPPALQPLSLSGEENFDLIILPYQVWYLAPSLPITAFLKHPLASRLLAGKPVVTVIACRNMWLLAQEKMKGLLTACGAKLADNVVFTDQGSTLASLITTPRWLLTGKRNAFMGLPAAGIHPGIIQRAGRFGVALCDALARNEEQGGRPMLSGLKAVDADPKLYFSERAGARSFYLWGKLLRAIGRPGQARRLPFLFCYVIFLITLILSVVPLSLFIQMLARPLLRRRHAAQKLNFDAPSGAGEERLHHYGHL